MNEEVRQLVDASNKLSDTAREAMNKVGKDETQESLKDWALKERAARLANETTVRTLLRHLRKIQTVLNGKYG